MKWLISVFVLSLIFGPVGARAASSNLPPTSCSALVDSAIVHELFEEQLQFVNGDGEYKKSLVSGFERPIDAYMFGEVSSIGGLPREMKFVSFEDGSVYFLSSSNSQFHDQPLILALGRKHLQLNTLKEIYEYFDKNPQLSEFPGTGFHLQRQGSRIFVKEFYELAKSSKITVGTIYSPAKKDHRDVPPYVFEVLYKDSQSVTPESIQSLYRLLSKKLLVLERETILYWYPKDHSTKGIDTEKLFTVNQQQFDFLIRPKNAAIYSEGLAAGYLTDKATGEEDEIVILFPGQALEFPEANGYISLGAQGQLSHGILAAKASRVPVVYAPANSQKMAKLAKEKRPAIISSIQKNIPPIIKPVDQELLDLQKLVREVNIPNYTGETDDKQISGKLDGLNELSSIGVPVPLFTHLEEHLYQKFLQDESAAMIDVRAYIQKSNIISAMGDQVIVRSNYEDEDQSNQKVTHGRYTSYTAKNDVDSIAQIIEKMFRESKERGFAGFKPIIQSKVNGVISGVAQIQHLYTRDDHSAFKFLVEGAAEEEGITSGKAKDIRTLSFIFKIYKDGHSELTGGGQGNTLNPSRVQSIAEELKKVTAHLMKTNKFPEKIWDKPFQFDLEWVVDSGMNIHFLQLRNSVPTLATYRPPLADRFHVPQELFSKLVSIVERKINDSFHVWEAYLPGMSYDSAITLGMVVNGEEITYDQIEGDSRPFMHHGIWETNVTLKDGRNFYLVEHGDFIASKFQNTIHIYTVDQLLAFWAKATGLQRFENRDAVIKLQDGREIPIPLTKGLQR